MTRPDSPITILLCTCNRPGMLRDALESVRRQTALASIARIVVSENSLDGESENVCAEFSDLPIVYVQQRPPVPALLHIKAIWPLVASSLVAILHDDDWWAPWHLQSALDILQSDEQCVATYSSFLESSEPRSFGAINQCYFLAWLATGADYSRPQLLDPPSVMLACLLNAGFHYSTVVGRAEAMWDAFSRNIASGNTFDNDRTFPVFLSRHGAVGYQANPSAFVRQHPFRDAWSPEHLKRGHMKMAQKTTRWLLDTYPQEIALAAEKFRSVVDQLTPHEASKMWRELRRAIYEPQWSTLVRECGIDLTAVKKRLGHGIWPRWSNILINDVCPPLVLRWAIQHRFFGGWEQYVRRWQKRASPSKPQNSAFND